jgi:hypothetical protein
MFSSIYLMFGSVRFSDSASVWLVVTIGIVIRMFISVSLVIRLVVNRVLG